MSVYAIFSLSVGNLGEIQCALLGDSRQESSFVMCENACDRDRSVGDSVLLLIDSEPV